MAEIHTVIIVGAGISGLLAAKTLHDDGFTDFLILEADERIGGRLMKHQFHGYTIELGAGSISSSGPISSDLVKIANDIKLKNYYSGLQKILPNTYNQDGKPYSTETVENAIQDRRTMDGHCKLFSNTLSSSNIEDWDTSILAAQKYFNKAPSTPLEMVIDFYYNDYQDGEPPKDTSVKHTYPRHEVQDFGETTRFLADERGFESIAHHIAGQFLTTENGVITDHRLKLNTMVTEIEHSDTGVTIKTEDGSKYFSKFVIVSVSIGVLQENLVQFNPPLPLAQQVAISDFNMAVYTKIFLKFPFTFWPTGPGSKFFLYAHGNRGYYPIWQHFDNEYIGSNILMVTVTDVEARRIERQSDKDTEREMMIVLRKIFGDAIPKPEEILVPRWSTNRLYAGSFANWPSRFSQKSYDILREAAGPIFFTGEHVSDKYIGSVHGAYYAGITTAEDLIKRIRIDG